VTTGADVQAAVPPIGLADDARPAPRRGVREFLSLPEGAIGTALVLLMLGVIVIGPFFEPYDPEEAGVGVTRTGPSAANWLGTDLLGRDVLSRVLAGGRSVILLPLIAVAIATALALVIGLLSGYLGGRVDAGVTRLLDVLLAVPYFLTVLVIIAGFGTSNAVVVIAVAFVYVPGMARVLRGATQAVRPREFVLAARARGDSLRWIVFREILPNIAPTLFVEAALRLTFAIMFIASLSFLGLGVQPPAPNWGVMVSEDRTMLFDHPLAPLVPAILIGLLAIGINLIADALTQVFGDERTRRVML
jgi:peptide/nickel transport system permease protein